MVEEMLHDSEIATVTMVQYKNWFHIYVKVIEVNQTHNGRKKSCYFFKINSILLKTMNPTIAVSFHQTCSTVYIIFIVRKIQGNCIVLNFVVYCVSNKDIVGDLKKHVYPANVIF